ncbi:hypothetical protein DdX_14434 [Ditylenchus destructor]|uniref:Uncharacterized protein n=1 Tax=Ditylenchus destructor TaxID=166010 RepID=A0AAD4MUJ1_9BILA|nr:hypothetical protein DdX_14434 [Ditylenchus destructor]
MSKFFSVVLIAIFVAAVIATLPPRPDRNRRDTNDMVMLDDAGSAVAAAPAELTIEKRAAPLKPAVYPKSGRNRRSPGRGRGDGRDG